MVAAAGGERGGTEKKKERWCSARLSMAESESETENEREREGKGARLLHIVHAGRAGEHASERGRHTALRPCGRSAIVVAAAQQFKILENY